MKSSIVYTNYQQRVGVAALRVTCLFKSFCLYLVYALSIKNADIVNAFQHAGAHDGSCVGFPLLMSLMRLVACIVGDSPSTVTLTARMPRCD